MIKRIVFWLFIITLIVIVAPTVVQGQEPIPEPDLILEDACGEPEDLEVPTIYPTTTPSVFPRLPDSAYELNECGKKVLKVDSVPELIFYTEESHLNGYWIFWINPDVLNPTVGWGMVEFLIKSDLKLLYYNYDSTNNTYWWREEANMSGTRKAHCGPEYIQNVWLEFPNGGKWDANHPGYIWQSCNFFSILFKPFFDH